MFVEYYFVKLDEKPANVPLFGPSLLKKRDATLPPRDAVCMELMFVPYITYDGKAPSKVEFTALPVLRKVQVGQDSSSSPLSTVRH